MPSHPFSNSAPQLGAAPPALTVEPRDGDLVSGQSVQIDCAASGQPRPSVSWLRARGEFRRSEARSLFIVRLA